MFRLATLRAIGFRCCLLLLLGSYARPAAAKDEQGLQLHHDAVHQAVTIHLPATAPRNNLYLSVLDAAGRVVYRKPLDTSSGPLISLPLNNYAAGTYVLIVEGPKGYNIAQRLVLK
ncbi:Por secretion system C-terminal sorting domain-containing protein [Hymenobacter daecheongensis DSM 21074]|uniref:Por secretion system C-terminal sorting domain-containing protein n=1 Tax=Hymenobacter daecheongensis DSM 21074 TaxID=1121955 RepID=A0A1M6HMZ7_9BACT|nr:T9SS type A sorting domain-containing protein [Hymenobacter daecheongensis]SHJ23575.1 Por secretion system C-terminal sorting domain-containing protein [Hymenobacter daecheongensis DSM 21074]